MYLSLVIICIVIINLILFCFLVLILLFMFSFPVNGFVFLVVKSHFKQKLQTGLKRLKRNNLEKNVYVKERKAEETV